MTEVTLTVKASSTTTYTIKVALSATVQAAKDAIQAQSNIPAANQRLIYSGQVMANDRTLESYGVKDGHTMHMVAKAPAAAAPTPATASPVPSPSPAAQPAAANPTPAAGATVNNQPLPNPFGAMFGGMGAGGAPMGGMGMGGMPMGGMGGLGGMDPNFFAQMMNNPMVQQQVQQMMANPQQMLANNPMAQQMLHANPQMMQMLQDPEFIRQMTDPRMIQMAMQMQNDPQMAQMMQGLGGLGGGLGGFPMPAAPATNPAASNAAPAANGAAPPPMNFANLFGGMGMGMPMAPPMPVQNPEERYAVQLQQLQDMGFGNRAVNIRVLQQVNGNVEAAVERLLMG